MTDTTNPQQAERRDRYAAAIRETDGWVLDGGQHMIDAVMAVADAEQAELRTRITELESSCRDVDRLRKDWVEMRDRVEELDERAKALAAAMVPASTPTDHASLLLRDAASYLSALHGSVARHDNLAANYGCAGCELRDQIRAELRRMADEIEAASGPGRVTGGAQQADEEPTGGTRQCGHDDYHPAHEWADRPNVWCPGHWHDEPAAVSQPDGEA
jgi:hypothetical protein